MKRFTLASTKNDISVLCGLNDVLALTVKEASKKFEKGDIEYYTIDCSDEITQTNVICDDKSDYIIMAGDSKDKYAFWNRKMWKVIDKPIGDFLDIMAGIKKEELEKFSEEFFGKGTE